MSWWNPLSWGSDAAADLAEEAAAAVGEAIAGLQKTLMEKPMIVIAPLTAMVAAVAVYNAARDGGREIGAKVVQELMEGEKNGQ